MKEKGKEMSQNIIAVYEDGILRPLEPLSLPEKQSVRIRVDLEKQMDSTENVFRSLLNIGWLKPPSGRSDVPSVPLIERNRVADILGQAAMKPSSRPAP